jgi:hypothetical protein
MFQFDAASRNAALDAIETTIGASPSLEFRSGTIPANTAAADAGAALAVATLPADWMAAASGGSKALLGTWEDPSADAGGVITHFRIKSGATTRMQGLCSDPWSQSRAYTVGHQVHANGNVYRCTVAGTAAGTGTGPSGTGASIADGTVTWAFVQTGTDVTLSNCVVNAGQPVTVTAFTLTAGGA